MSVSSVGSTSSGLFEFLKALQNQNSPSNTSGSATTGADADGQKAQSSSGHHHHHGGGGGSLISKIESAVTTALQSAAPGSDPNKTIQDAITQALGSSGATGSTDSTTPTDPPQQTDGTQQAFLQLLQANGVTSQQFQQDIQTALEQAQSSGGALDFSKIFSSFPPGSNVDTTA